MEKDETLEPLERFMESGHEKFNDVKEQWGDAFNGVDTLTGHIVLLSQMVYRVSTYSDKTLAELALVIAAVAHNLMEEEPAETKTIPPNFMSGRQFNVELAELNENPSRAVIELEWVLDRLDTHGGVYCTGVGVMFVAMAYNVTIDSLVSIVVKRVAELQEYDQTPEGQAELAGGTTSLLSESLLKTTDACFKLMHAAVTHGPEGFLAYRDASPYLRSPSGWKLRKYVAETEFEGKHAPIRAEVSAAFNSSGKCKWTTARFSGLQRDLVEIRELVCESLARKHGKPVISKRDRVEWIVQFDDARVTTVVELDGFGNLWTLSVTEAMKHFW